MAQVHEYAILTETGQHYRSEGTSHNDALNRFIINPVIVVGFHEGDYEATPGEQFVVVGPGDEGPMTITKLIAQQSNRISFDTPEQIERDREMSDKIWNKWILDRKSVYEVIVNHNMRTPPYDLKGVISIKMPLGVRVNNLWVPWRYVEDIVPIKGLNTP